MRFREYMAWVIVVFLAVGIGVQSCAVRKSDLENGRLLYECALQLDDLGTLRTHAADTIRDFGNRIVECEIRICRVNGWTPPEDWDETLEMYDAANKHASERK